MFSKTNAQLSVIIPAFNEVKRIESTLAAADEYLKEKRISYEIIVVDDGSKDGTAALVRHLAEHIKYLSVLKLPYNQGKGAAVKKGMLAADGDLMLFMDADGSTNINELEKLIPYASQGYDIIFGSRLVQGAVKQTRQGHIRELLGWVFRTLSHLLTGIDVIDPQNGFKLFTQSAGRRIFSEIKTDGWSFDVEIFVLAKRFNLKVREVPIVWVNDERSKISFVSMLRMLFDLLKLSIATRYVR